MAKVFSLPGIPIRDSRRSYVENVPVIFITGVNCQPGEEVKLNRWYNESHVPMLMSYEGLKAAERFRILKENPEYPTYIALYNYVNLEYFEKQGEAPFYAAVTTDREAT
jgi:hypothetical protein